MKAFQKIESFFVAHKRGFFIAAALLLLVFSQSLLAFTIIGPGVQHMLSPAHHRVGTWLFLLDVVSATALYRICCAHRDEDDKDDDGVFAFWAFGLVVTLIVQIIPPVFFADAWGWDAGNYFLGIDFIEAALIVTYRWAKNSDKLISAP